MKLSALLGRPVEQDVDVTGLAIDSRKIEPGNIFAAFSGLKTDGAQFIAAAVEKGAIAVVALPTESVVGALHLPADNPRAAMAALAARYFNRQPAVCVAVTGTNGKTSTVDMARQLWQTLGKNASSIGTLGIISAAGTTETGMTSPDVISFQQTLASLADAGIEALAFEASSHALDQYRVQGAHIRAAAFTNLTRDHLDYHGTLEAYGAAKAKLFLEMLPAGGVAVINMDDDYGQQLAKDCAARKLSMIRFGEQGVELKLLKRDILLQGQHLTVSFNGTRTEVLLPLVGAFQAHNALAAAGLLIGAGENPAAVFTAMAKLQGVPGRLEHVATTIKGAAVYVDYAHTPDGLRAALEALRPHTQAKLWLVFGCGGDRDRGKRPQMGAIGTELADQLIVTDDNPRTEDAAFVRSEILAAAPQAQEIGDRRTAIAASLALAGAGDVVLVAGKGHERGQTVGTTVLPFHDGTVVQELVQEMAA
jgi:UDP-N-acetylmuramoyl-L-alanyl-D-glutamate--2,6-diaminopimelate ligase